MRPILPIAMILCALALPVAAQQTDRPAPTPKPDTPAEQEAGPAAPASAAPYDAKLQRLAEVLGSIHYLRSLCGETGNPWREQMQGLLEAESPEGDRRARLIAAFNRGYRSFASVHVKCTATAVAAVERYMQEGNAISAELIAQYGN